MHDVVGGDRGIKTPIRQCDGVGGGQALTCLSAPAKEKCVESMRDLAVWEGFETGKELDWGGFEAVESWGGGCSPPGSWPHAAFTFDVRTCLLQREEREKVKKRRKYPACCRRERERKNITCLSGREKKWYWLGEEMMCLGKAAAGRLK
jgi:hypothetical protein